MLPSWINNEKAEVNVDGMFFDVLFMNEVFLGGLVLCEIHNFVFIVIIIVMNLIFFDILLWTSY